MNLRIILDGTVLYRVVISILESTTFPFGISAVKVFLKKKDFRFYEIKQLTFCKNGHIITARYACRYRVLSALGQYASHDKGCADPKGFFYSTREESRIV